MKAKKTLYLIPLLILTIIITFCSFSCSTPSSPNQIIEETAEEKNPEIEDYKAKIEIINIELQRIMDNLFESIAGRSKGEISEEDLFDMVFSVPIWVDETYVKFLKISPPDEIKDIHIIYEKAFEYYLGGAEYLKLSSKVSNKVDIEPLENGINYFQKADMLIEKGNLALENLEGRAEIISELEEELKKDVNIPVGISQEGMVEESAPEEEITEKEEDKYLKAGMYKVGEDIPGGEYLITAEEMGYYQVTKDSSGSLDSIISNDNFSNTRYITVLDGQYLEIKRAKMILSSEAEPQKPEDGEYFDGMYKVGKDIPTGEYKVISTEGMAYFEVSKDSMGTLDSIVANDNFDGEKYVTIKDGQYLKLKYCKLEVKSRSIEEEDTENIKKESSENKNSSSTEEIAESDNSNNTSNIQPIIDSATDSLGHTNTNSWAKETGGDWPSGGLEASPTIYIGDVITFTINVSNSSNLEYRFIMPGGTTQDWSASNVCTWTVPKEAYGKWKVVTAQVRNNDGLNFLGECDDYTYLTYTILSK